LRCHAPQGWLEGRATPTDGSMLDWNDREGVSCAICHRMVDPFLMPDSPAPDSAILAELGIHSPVQSLDHNGIAGNIGNGGYVVDPLLRLRGPFPIGTLPPGQNPPPAVNCAPFHASWYQRPTFESPLHRRGAMCASCHDVSTPHFVRNPATNN